MTRKLVFVHSIQKYYDPAVTPGRVYTHYCICENGQECGHDS